MECCTKETPISGDALAYLSQNFSKIHAPCGLANSLRAKDKVLTRQVSKLLTIPKKMVYEARDCIEASRYVCSLGTIYRDITITSPSTIDKVDPGPCVSVVQKQ